MLGVGVAVAELATATAAPVRLESPPLVAANPARSAERESGQPVPFIGYPVDGHFPPHPARSAGVHARGINAIGAHFQL